MRYTKPYSNLFMLATRIIITLRYAERKADLTVRGLVLEYQPSTLHRKKTWFLRPWTQWLSSSRSVAMSDYEQLEMTALSIPVFPDRTTLFKVTCMFFCRHSAHLRLVLIFYLFVYKYMEPLGWSRESYTVFQTRSPCSPWTESRLLYRQEDS